MSIDDEDQNESDIFDWYSTKRTSLATHHLRDTSHRRHKKKSIISTTSKWRSLQRLKKTFTARQQSPEDITRKNTGNRTHSLF